MVTGVPFTTISHMSTSQVLNSITSSPELLQRLIRQTAHQYLNQGTHDSPLLNMLNQHYHGRSSSSTWTHWSLQALERYLVESYQPEYLETRFQQGTPAEQLHLSQVNITLAYLLYQELSKYQLCQTERQLLEEHGVDQPEKPLENNFRGTLRYLVCTAETLDPHENMLSERPPIPLIHRCQITMSRLQQVMKRFWCHYLRLRFTTMYDAKM